jgi:ABC-2 type transport system ATP-binding protein
MSHGSATRHGRGGFSCAGPEKPVVVGSARSRFVLAHREIYNIDSGAFDTKVEELSELLQIKELLKVPVRKLSLGERMKCEIAASLLHSPEVLFLDEPTIGLDVVSQVRIRNFLRDYNERTGITVLLTSHYMADIEALCKRVIVVNEGRIMYDGSLRNLADRFANQRRIRLTLADNADPSTLQQSLPNFAGGKVECDGYNLTITVPRDEVPTHVATLLQTLPVDDLTVEDVEIESVIRDLFARHAAERSEPAQASSAHDAAPSGASA